MPSASHLLAIYSPSTPWLIKPTADCLTIEGVRAGREVRVTIYDLTSYLPNCSPFKACSKADVNDWNLKKNDRDRTCAAELAPDGQRDLVGALCVL